MPNILRHYMPYISHDDKWAQLIWRRHKDYKVLSDAQPDKISYAIRLAILSKQRNFYHLPYYQAMLISEDCLQMKVKKPEICLRDALVERDNMA